MFFPQSIRACAPLPERLHKDRATGSSAWVQETYAENFSCLLRVGHSPAEGECTSEGDKHPTNFGFSIQLGQVLDFRLSEKESSHRIQ